MGVKKFHRYLYGRTFSICTEHTPLLGLLEEHKAIPPMPSARIQRWVLFLSAYQYKVHYRSGADALSRLPLPEMGKQEESPEEVILTLKVFSRTPVKAVDIAQLTGKDPTLARVRSFLWHGWPKERTNRELQPYAQRRAELGVVDGCLPWGQESWYHQLCTMRDQILKELHEGHPSVSRMRSLGRSYVWWSGMVNAIAQTAHSVNNHQRRSHFTPGSGQIGRGPLFNHLWEGCSLLL